MDYVTIKAPSELRAGNNIDVMRHQLSGLERNYYSSDIKYHLDLSEVIFMDSSGFRLVFDYLSIFSKVTPPKDTHIVELYNTWLDSKKGLSK